MRLNEFPDCCAIGIFNQLHGSGSWNFGSHIKPVTPTELDTYIKNKLAEYLFTSYLVTLIKEQKLTLEPILIKHGFKPIHTFTSKKTASVITIYLRAG
jgi:hypothetical protein